MGRLGITEAAGGGETRMRRGKKVAANWADDGNPVKDS